MRSKKKICKDRIKKLGIPPNWKNVKISPDPTARIQATGEDSKGKVQYIYHPMWVELRGDYKFNNKLGEFRRKENLLKKAISECIRSKNEKTYHIGVMLFLLIETCIRVGNPKYEKINSTYGLCTLKKSHFSIINGKIRLKFKGKRNIIQNITIHNVKLIQHLKKILNKTKSGRIFCVEPIELNAYIQKILGKEFTCKDIRMYYANLDFVEHLTKTSKGSKKDIKEAYQKTANKLGNTTAITKKSYVSPGIVGAYSENPSAFIGKNPEKKFRDCVG